jgi:deoxyribodipyrimidine photo-lyase
MNKYNKSLFIFRRDFRITDNTALNECIKNSKEILFSFIFTKEQIDPKINKFFSPFAFNFLLCSLKELSKIIPLNIYYDDNFDNGIKLLTSIIKNNNINSIYYNVDYTDYAKKRDSDIKNSINFIDINEYEDYLLHSIDILEKHYKKFTPFYNTISKINVRKPHTEKLINKIIIDKFSDKLIFDKLITEYDKVINNYNFNINNYNSDIKIHEKSTNISAFVKFGLHSIREFYYMNKNKEFRRSLYWHDYYYYYEYYNANIKYIKWNESIKDFNNWCNGTTGIEIIDICMKQLNETGQLNNRGRMIVSNYLIKILKINWQKGEHYFATKLIDYDVLVNRGNWRWMSQYPWTFSPDRQMKKYYKDL